ncbi:MAG: hypothetical protein ACR2NM_09645 [Bythopirellula sp.]
MQLSPGDFNSDRFVDGKDFLEWQHDPNIGDLPDWQLNYGAGTISTATVPEASTTALLVIGLATIWGKRSLPPFWIAG